MVVFFVSFRFWLKSAKGEREREKNYVRERLYTGWVYVKMREPLLGFANWRQNRSMGVFSAWEFRCSLFNAGFSVQLLLFSLFIRLRLAFCFKNELSECVNESVYCESQPCVFFLFLLLININAMLSMKWFVFSADFVRIDFNQFHCVSMSIINSLFFSFYSFALSVRPCVFFNTHHVLSLSPSFFVYLLIWIYRQC